MCNEYVRQVCTSEQMYNTVAMFNAVDVVVVVVAVLLLLLVAK